MWKKLFLWGGSREADRVLSCNGKSNVEKEQRERHILYMWRGRQTKKKKQGMNWKEKGLGGSNKGIPPKIPDSPKWSINELVENIHAFWQHKKLVLSLDCDERGERERGKWNN